MPGPSPTPTATLTPAPTVSLGFLEEGTPVGTEPTLTATATLAVPTPTPESHQWMLPSRVIPEPVGVNIHFTQPDPGEMELLERAGFRFVRMDLFWHLIEHEERGKYDFSAYDVLVEEMSSRGIRIIFILDYGNDLWGGGNAHHLEEGRPAFVRFAATAARRYRGQGIIWEIWNEPNLEKFWHAPPDPANYADLAFKVIAAVRREDPAAWIVGPAAAHFPWDYLEVLGELGLYNKLDAVTVHPYRHNAPESAWEDYVRLRGILDHASPDRKIPIIAGEWGYSTVAGGHSEELQAQYLTRQMLSHLAADVDLSIWYDWRNDGENPQEIEHNFGVVRADLTPKPAYHAVETMIDILEGYHFQRRIPLTREEDYLLLFFDGEQVALAAWTAGAPHEVLLPIYCDAVEVVEMTGETSLLDARDGGLEVALDLSPRYLRLCDSETVLRMGLWRPSESIHILPLDGEGRVLMEIENPFHEPLQGEFRVTAGGELLGSTWGQADPHTITKVSVPVSVEAESATIIPAIVTFLTPDGLPLESASIWLHLVTQ